MRTYKKKTRKHKTRKQRVTKNKQNKKGGLLIRGDPKEAFNKFMTNSEITIFRNTGVNSVIFKATINKGIISPYENYNLINYGKAVETILIKLVALDIKDNQNVWFYRDKTKYIVPVEEFQKEAKIQNDIFLKTVENLQPICPGIVYDDILKKDDLSLIKLNFFDYMHNIDNIQSWGIIGMEIPEGFDKTLNNYYSDNEKNIHKLKSITYDNYLSYEQIAKLQLLNMALKTGYSHNDLHLNNILLNENSEKVLLIDFGYATEIADNQLNILKEYEKNEKFQEALNYIYDNFERSDGDEISNHPKEYGWIYSLDRFDSGSEYYEKFNNYYKKYYKKDDEKYDEKDDENEKDDEYKKFKSWLADRKILDFTINKCNTIMKELKSKQKLEYDENQHKIEELKKEHKISYGDLYFYNRKFIHNF